VQRISRGRKLRPHRLRTLKCSHDPRSAAKHSDACGLYIDPPAHAVVLSLDEKSQIQALDRTQPGLPLKPRRRQTMTHDYKRHGTTTLFAALSVLDGTVIGLCMQRHRHLEFIRFLNAVERQVAADRSIHVVLDNYATHKHPKVLASLARHPRWTFHFIPTSASWLNAVENFFSKMTRQRIRRGVFHSIADLQAAINAYLAEHNGSPKPFVWTKSADAILAKLHRVPVSTECV
jgi:transposase